MTSRARTTGNTTSQRLERKYPLAEDMLAPVSHALAERLPVRRYQPGVDWSSLRTIYLDTPDMGCYQEYLQELPVRQKIRIRQYGVDGRFDQHCWVEMKIKNQGVSLKNRFRCMTEHLPPMLAGEDIAAAVREHNDADGVRIYAAIRAFMMERDLKPLVRVDYERLSFGREDDPSVRVTLDRQVRFCSATREYAGTLEGLVLEIKYAGDRPAWMPELKTALELKRQLRFSKFARSVRQLEKMQENDGLW